MKYFTCAILIVIITSCDIPHEEYSNIGILSRNSGVDLPVIWERKKTPEYIYFVPNNPKNSASFNLSIYEGTTKIRSKDINLTAESFQVSNSFIHDPCFKVSITSLVNLNKDGRKYSIRISPLKNEQYSNQMKVVIRHDVIK